MAENTEQYLSFDIEHISYVVSVMDVIRICLRAEAEQIEELHWLTLGTKKECPKAEDCILLLGNSEEPYGIYCDKIQGVVQIEPAEQFALPASLQKQYPWLLGVSALRGEKLLLVLDGQALGRLEDEVWKL